MTNPVLAGPTCCGPALAPAATDMETRHHVLVAAQAAAWPVLRGMLEDTADLVHVETMAEAMRVLEAQPARFDLIVCTLTFSDHRMLEFLLAVKSHPALAGIPLLACRTLVGRLSEDLVRRMGEVVRQCGAEFVNIALYGEAEGKAALRAAVAGHARGRQGSM